MPVSGLGSGGAESPPSTSTHKASPADTSAARNAEFLKALAERSDAERVAGGGTAGDSSSATDAASRGGRLTLPLHLYNASEDEVKLDREAARTFRDYSAIGAIGGGIGGLAVTRYFRVGGIWRPAVVCGIGAVIGYRLGVRTAAMIMKPRLLELQDSVLADQLRRPRELAGALEAADAPASSTTKTASDKGT